MQAILMNPKLERWEPPLPPRAPFISREIGFGLQITSFATVVTKRKMFGRTPAKKAK